MTDYKTLMKTYKGFLFCATKTELAELNLGTDRLNKKFTFDIHLSKSSTTKICFGKLQFTHFHLTHRMKNQVIMLAMP